MLQGGTILTELFARLYTTHDITAVLEAVTVMLVGGRVSKTGGNVGRGGVGAGTTCRWGRFPQLITAPGEVRTNNLISDDIICSDYHMTDLVIISLERKI